MRQEEQNNRGLWGKRVALIVVSIFLLSSSVGDLKNKFTAEEMLTINQEVAVRLQAYITKQEGDCQADLMQEVEDAVDTLLIFRFKELMQERANATPTAPPRPTAPSKPKSLAPKDDIPLQPLIDEQTLTATVKTLPYTQRKENVTSSDVPSLNQPKSDLAVPKPKRKAKRNIKGKLPIPSQSRNNQKLRIE